jgi:hypothetical protein
MRLDLSLKNGDNSELSNATKRLLDRHFRSRKTRPTPTSSGLITSKNASRLLRNLLKVSAN